jgi:hypothetical protein
VLSFSLLWVCFPRRAVVAASHREDAEECELQGRPGHPVRPLHGGGDGRRRRPRRDGVPSEEGRRRGGVPVPGHQGHLRVPVHHRRRRLQGAEAEGRRHLPGTRVARPRHPVLHRPPRRLSELINNLRCLSYSNCVDMHGHDDGRRIITGDAKVLFR